MQPTVSVEVRHPGPGGADLFVRPLQGRANRWAEQPWAAGTKTVPLPTATQFKPLRGSDPPPLDLVTPGVQQKIWVKISSSEEGGSLITPLLIQADRYPYLLLDTGGADVAEAKSSPEGANYLSPGQRPGSENPFPPSRKP